MGQGDSSGRGWHFKLLPRLLLPCALWLSPPSLDVGDRNPKDVHRSQSGITTLPTRNASPLSHFTLSFNLLQYKRHNFPFLGGHQVFPLLPFPGISQGGGPWSVGNEELLPNSTNARPSRNPTRSFFMLRADPGSQDRSRELLPRSFICFPTLHHQLLLILWADSLGVIRGKPSSSLDWDLQRNEFPDEVTSPQRADSCHTSALPQVYVLGLVPWKKEKHGWHCKVWPRARAWMGNVTRFVCSFQSGSTSPELAYVACVALANSCQGASDSRLGSHVLWRNYSTGWQDWGCPKMSIFPNPVQNQASFLGPLIIN